MASTASEGSLGFRATLGVLRPGPFRRYILGEAVSVTGTWMQIMAQGWLMATLTTSAFMLGLVNFAGSLPMLLLGMAGGVFADRYDKRWILQITQIVQIVAAAAIGFLVQRGELQLWHLFAMAVATGTAAAFEMPAAGAMVPELVDKPDIARAIAIDRSVFHATRLVGPALAGYCIAHFGAATAFYLNALSFVALMIAIATLPARPLGTPEQEEGRKTGMKDGIAYVRSDPPTLGMIGLIALTTTLVFPLIVVLMPIYAVHVLKLGPGQMGILMGLAGVGALTGSVGMLTVGRAQRLSRMAIGAAGTVAALAALTVASGMAVAAAGILVLGVGISTLIGLANTTVQERAPDHLRGRVSAIAGLAFFGVMPFAGLALSSVTDLLGMRTVLGVNAVLYAIGSFAILTTLGRQACAERSGTDEAEKVAA